MSVRYFCDCCGSEITDTNRIEGNKGRLFGALRPKIKTQSEPLQVEVTTALGSCWNSGHFCKYCVIDAVNSKDDRPIAATVPEHKFRESETRYMNVLLDLDRVAKGEPTLCNFPEVEVVRSMLAAASGVMAVDARHCGNCADGVPGGPDNCSKCGRQQQYSHWMPRFQKTYCSQCGGEFGPGNHGYSHCEDHGGKP